MGIFSSPEEKHKEEVEKAHNAGQKDASDGEYHPPYGPIDSVTLFYKTQEEMDEVNESYKTGYEHTKSQR